jgi:RNA exonuclease 1
MLSEVTTQLPDIQKKLLDIITPRTVIAGHSLNSDLMALKMTHPFIVDTTLLYPHPRGLPLRSSLKYLSQKYLGREIQSNHGKTGHDSLEDARACLDLIRQKCEKGPLWGTAEGAVESIFQKLKRMQQKGQTGGNGSDERFRTGAAIDWGDPSRGLGKAATLCIGCDDDTAVVQGVKAAVSGSVDNPAVTNEGVDFIWARFRELEAVRGWWSKSKTADIDHLRTAALQGVGVDQNGNVEISETLEKTVKHITEIYDFLPSGAALIVYSGGGDPRDHRHYSDMYQQYKTEYATKKWDELSVQWTDKEEQLFRRAYKKARDGMALITVKPPESEPISAPPHDSTTKP